MTKILIAAGGTGGHMFPAISFAHVAAKEKSDVYFITDKRGMKYTKVKGSIKFKKILAAGVGDKNIFSKIWGMFLLGLGFFQSLWLVKKFNPDMVVGFGGYTSFPVLLAAIVWRKKFIIHEQNAVVGRVNKIFASRSVAIATSFAETRGIEKKSQAVLVGNPIRDNIAKLTENKYKRPSSKGEINLFITGGSQGALVLDKVVPQAIRLLKKDIKNRLKIVEQVRSENVKQVTRIYERSGVKKIEIRTFFKDMPKYLRTSHLYIGRSGASVAEIAAAGIPAVFIPINFHKDRQQYYNAKNFENNEAAIIIEQKDFTPNHLAFILEQLLRDSTRLEEMAKNSKSLAIIDAPVRLLKLVKNKIA